MHTTTDDTRQPNLLHQAVLEQAAIRGIEEIALTMALAHAEQERDQEEPERWDGME